MPYGMIFHDQIPGTLVICTSVLKSGSISFSHLTKFKNEFEAQAELCHFALAPMQAELVALVWSLWDLVGRLALPSLYTNFTAEYLF